MNYTRVRLLKKAQYWEGASLDKLLEKRNGTLMITIEMPVEEWDKIWQADAAEDMSEALKEMLKWFGRYPVFIPNPELQESMMASINQGNMALAKYEGRE